MQVKTSDTQQHSWEEPPLRPPKTLMCMFYWYLLYVYIYTYILLGESSQDLEVLCDSDLEAMNGHLEGERCPVLRRLPITMIIEHLLTGMILQVRIQVCPKRRTSPTIYSGHGIETNKYYSREGSGFLGYKYLHAYSNIHKRDQQI